MATYGGVIVGPLVASGWTANCLTAGPPKNLLAGAAFMGGGGCWRAIVVRGEAATDVANCGGDGEGALASTPAVGNRVGVTCTGLTAGSGDGGVAVGVGAIGVTGTGGGAEVAYGDAVGPP